MKRLFLLIILISCVFAITGCKKAPQNTDTAKKDLDTKNTSSAVRMANPWSDFSTLSEATKTAGFDIELPVDIIASLSGFENYDTIYRVLTGGNVAMIEVIYKTNGDELRFRKAQTSGDISGDYNNYTDTKTMLVGSKNITLKGQEELYSLVTWVGGDFSYTISTTVAKNSNTLTNLVALTN